MYIIFINNSKLINQLNAFKSNWIDGPILVHINKLLKYLPLTPDGRFCSIDWYKDFKFSIRDFFPTPILFYSYKVYLYIVCIH